MGIVAGREGQGDDAAGGELRVYARNDDREIKLIADGTPVPGARLFDKAFFETAEMAAAVSKHCADFLEKSHMPADRDGWHPLPARRLPVLIAAARNAVWAAMDGPSVPSAQALPPQNEHPPDDERKPWTRHRVAQLGRLVGEGRTAKQIAVDPAIGSTPYNVQRQANKFGLWLSEQPKGQVTCRRLPIDSVAVIDKAAAAAHLTREEFVRSWIIKATRDPARYGMVVVVAG